MKRILILCTGNSCRSQMAEGYMRHFVKDKAEVFSAGLEAHGVNPIAVSIMKEDGIDISNQTSNTIDDYRDIDFDFVITVCDNAKEHCPYFPSNALMYHQDFPDPSKLIASPEDIRKAFKEVRVLIRQYCHDFAANQGFL
ncbi:MAG: arsenate reductase ArsC [Bacteroidota bacterium]|nr:arsenate reductase ArsC [Bacteroidota bacterium]